MDEADYIPLSTHSWCYLEAGYAVRGTRIGGKPCMIYMHRELLNPPEGMEVDHINRNKLDYRRSNLRLATSTEQKGNTGISSRNTSGYRGVYWRKDIRKWSARISIADRTCHLGTFVAVEEAVKVYNAAAVKHFGAFAATNSFINHPSSEVCSPWSEVR